MYKQTNIGNTKWFVWLSIISIIIAIFVFVTGKNLPDLFRSLKAPITTWITCNANVQVEDTHFKWTGPEKGVCTISLDTGEFVVGTIDNGFQASIFASMSSDHCAAFALRGPLELSFSIDKGGGGDFYSSVKFRESFLQEKYAELDAHPTCNQNFHGYDKIECQDGSCRILP